LDPGERDAILLAEEVRADLLLIDERQGRLEARRRGITTTGTLGVLLAAGARGLVTAEYAFQRLLSETVRHQRSEKAFSLKAGNRARTNISAGLFLHSAIAPLALNVSVIEEAPVNHKKRKAGELGLASAA
jgi:hypothetical protein